MTATTTVDLRELRRTFHRYPEPAWREFYTTATLAERLDAIGVDELAIGPDAYDPEDRMAAPDPADVEPWMRRAVDRGADEERVERMGGGNTGLVAVLDAGAGPHVGLRVDIDGLYVEESDAADHAPASDGFRSEHPETMHACGHDVHMTWGLAVVDAVSQSDFEGRLTVFFQPAEEVSGGGRPMAQSDYAADLDYLFAAHVGLGHPTGEVVAGVERVLAMCHVDATYEGTSAHAGKAPNEGDNAMQALGTAIQNAYAIPRHADGMTRVNVGVAEAGTASNVIAEEATIRGEARGETTELMEYMKDRLRRTLRTAGEMHGCDARIEVVSESPRVDSDPDLAGVVADAAADVRGVDTVRRHADFGASEDATFLMERAHAEGGQATYLIVGTDHPTSHHTSRFDVDERSLRIGAEVLTEAVLSAGGSP